MSVFTIAIYHTDLQYGGPEDGGWWYTAGFRTRIVSRSSIESVAIEICKRVNRQLCQDQDAKGIPNLSSVLSEGREIAYVFEGPAPEHFPLARPNYE